jgi:hypothetical protein
MWNQAHRSIEPPSHAYVMWSTFFSRDLVMATSQQDVASNATVSIAGFRSRQSISRVDREEADRDEAAAGCQSVW